MPKIEHTSTNRIPQSALGALGYNVPHLKCLYTKALRMRNKPEELKALVQSQRFYILGMRETQWDESRVQSAVLDASRLLRRDVEGRRGAGEAQDGTAGWQCLELTVGSGTAQGLWTRIEEQRNDVDITVGIPSPQESPYRTESSACQVSPVRGHEGD